MIGVDQSEYELGEIVFWTASVNATDFSNPNFGLAVGQASLTEDRGETLSEANYALTPVNNYFPKFGGTGGAGFLNGFTAATFDSNAAIENVEDAVFTPFATGTFTTTVLGAYIDNYSRCLGGANAFYIENDGVLPEPTNDYDTLIGGSVNFNDSAAAVPKPSSLVLISIAAFGAGGGALDGIKLDDTTVHDDAQRYTLWGNRNRDWFFARLGGASRNKLDKVRDLRSNEELDEI
jgi:hypothetical protein